jgi:hypothetical protein
MPRRSACQTLACLLLTLTFVGWPREKGHAGEQTSVIPAWLAPHVGEGEGQIAGPVLERARTLYRRKVEAGIVRNPCYFAMDATRPNDTDAAGRFYVICEAEQSFQAVSAGHGGGRKLESVADFQNGRTCAQHFGNAMNSNLTAGGAYVTGHPTTSFKGYYRVSPHDDVPFLRTFLPFDGEGETDNARARAIGGHAAATMKGVCLRRAAGNPYAGGDGYVPFGALVDYTGGRSDGCTSWSPSDAQRIIALVENYPTTLYIYPASADIEAVARAVATGRSPSRDGLYWNSTCLMQIGAPKFWPKAVLEPIIRQYTQDHPAPPPKPTPLCTTP